MRRNRAEFRQLAQALAAETKTYISGLGAPHPFVARLLNSLGMRPSDFLNLVSQKNDQFLSSCSSDSPISYCHRETKIEKFCHKIWLTSSEEPHLPPEDLLVSYFSMCKSHPPDWTHLFWTNNAHVLRHVSARALDEAAKVLVLNIDSMPIGAIETTLRQLIAHRKFVLAADVLKFIILDRYGGIYSDLGVFFDEAILEIAAAADFTFLFASNMFFQTSWVSLAKGSLLSSLFLGVMNNPEIFSIEYALDESKTINAGTEVHTFAGLGYTTCALLFLPRSATCFAFPENLRQLKWRGQQSWYGDAPKFGNALINTSIPSVFEQEKYGMYALRAQERLRTINANGRLIEMAKILVNLFEYYQSNPTPLCKSLSYNGSDKVGGWHNYGYVYFFLMGTFAHRDCTILEVGDALSLWGKSGSGEHEFPLGGSMRAWQEYMGAVTLGAEIDRSVTGGFSLDHAVLINNGEQITLRAQLERHRYDVIIDNGVHRFDASVSLLEAAFGELATSGIYVIEAVPVGDIGLWEQYLNAANKTALVMSFPSTVNDRDNCLVVIMK
jgi:hypothetical protein